MTIEELANSILSTTNRYNSMLYDQKGLYTDGIKNLSDLKEQYGRKNGETWVNNLTYSYGEIVSFNNNIYISLQNNNLNKFVNDTSYWKLITKKNIVNGEYYAGAFTNILMANDYLLTLNNNFNIASVAYQTIGQGIIGGIHLINLRFKNEANISNTNYLVFPTLNYNIPTVNNNTIIKTPGQIQVYDKKITGVTLITEYVPNREISVVIVPQQ